MILVGISSPVLLVGVSSPSAATTGGVRHAPARLAIDGIERRRIPVRVGGSTSALDLHVVEVADWSWWEEQSVSESANPFGAKLWPASLAVADYLAGLPAEVLPATTVLEIGCGNGLCSLTAAARGATSVVASDLSEDALTLTQEAAGQQGLVLQTLRFDLADRATPLPPAQLVIAADVLCARTRFEPTRDRAAQPLSRPAPPAQMTPAWRPLWRTEWPRPRRGAAGSWWATSGAQGGRRSSAPSAS